MERFVDIRARGSIDAVGSAVGDDGTPFPPYERDAELYYQPTTHPGAHLPHVWLERDRREVSTLDLCAYDRFTLITGVGGDDWGEAARQVSRATGVPIHPVVVGLGQVNNDVLACGCACATSTTAAACSSVRIASSPGAAPAAAPPIDSRGDRRQVCPAGRRTLRRRHAMVELYHYSFSTCSQKVRLVLAEKQIEFVSREVDILSGKQHEPAYVALNPNHVAMAPLRLARDAALVPNLVTAAHFEALRPHFDEAQIVELVAVCALFGFLNRWNDTMSTELESTPRAFAAEHLTGAGWTVDKHR